MILHYFIQHNHFYHDFTINPVLDFLKNNTKPVSISDAYWKDRRWGEGWSWDDYERLFQEAKAFEPGFWSYDIAKATYLLPRWHGQPGEWEYALGLEIDQRKGGLGLETYTRVVDAMQSYYTNIFRESKVSWPLTRDGFELMRQRYPNSMEILSDYCWLACLAEDRALARKLFDELGGRMVAAIWSDQKNFQNYRQWAYSR